MKMDCYAPDELLAKYRAIRSTVPADIFYRKPEYRKVMELWCAAQFARGFAANLDPSCLVLIHENDAQEYYDFQLEIKSEAERLNFQLTEVLQEGRRRGDEYRQDAPRRVATLADWDWGSELGGQATSSAINKKFKRYGGDVSNLNLLIYLNYLDADCSLISLREQVADASDPWRSVWLLCHSSSETLAIACAASKDAMVLAQLGDDWLTFPSDPHEFSK